MSIKAVVFDLDDTLYPEIDYVKSGFCAVGEEMQKRFGVQDAARRLNEYFAADRRDVYGRVLRDYGVAFTEGDIADLIRVYRTHIPKLSLSTEVRETLLALREQGYKLGIVTDGRPFQQRAKIQALGLKELVDTIVITDELGGAEYRKPHPKAFEILCGEFGVKAEETVYVGDNPQKDFAVKKFLPMTTVMVKGGLYRDGAFLYGIVPDVTVETVAALKELVL